MTAKLLTRRLLRVSLIILGVLVALLLGFHFWFKAHAKGLIEDLVEQRSHGKLKLKIKKFHFSYFSRKIEMDDAVFYTTDTVNSSTAYRFTVKKIKLRAKAILPIVFSKRILIDSLHLQKPRIEVTRLKVIDKPDRKEKEDVSIPEEMGKVYSSIQDALEVLKVKRFQIDDGTFTLINKIDADQLPLKITNLYFHIDNFKVDSNKLRPHEKILFSDNIAFRSHDQNILFPDGRHRLSFSQFRINLQNKLVEFDSCTIAATRTDSSTASFDVFFDALFLTNIDFDTLYKSEVIKADSVYCVNPRFNLDVPAGRKKDSSRSAPSLQNIIKQLTGDLQLKHVIVNNADFNIRTVQDGKPTTFSFTKNNFEMEGLDIDQEAKKPIRVKSFAMAIRNYENFIKDSTYSIKFDSILFKDDKITLSNFLFTKLGHGKTLNSFSIPQFNLQGLSWDDLVFERRLKADQAIMFNPHIIYSTANRQKTGRKQSIFQSLGAVNDFMDLQFLDITDGYIDLTLKNDLRVQLQNADVSIKSNSLLGSTKLAGIRNSLSSLNFKKGSIQAGNLLIELDDIRYAGKEGALNAGSMHVTDKARKAAIALEEVTVKKLLVDELTGNIYADGLNWLKGNVNIIPGNITKSSRQGPVIELHHVKGMNTPVDIALQGKTIKTFISNISFTHLFQKPGSQFKLAGLSVSGDQLKIKDPSMELSSDSYSIIDSQASFLENLNYSSKNEKTDMQLVMPWIKLVPHIQETIDGHVVFDDLKMERPVVTFQTRPGQINNAGPKKDNTNIDINSLSMNAPTVHFEKVTDSNRVELDWQGSKNGSNFFQAAAIKMRPGSLQGNDIRFYLSDLVFKNAKGKDLSTGNGKVSGHINSAGMQENGNEPADWNLDIASLDAKDLHLDSIGKLNGSFVMQTGVLNRVKLNSASLPDLQELVAMNKDLSLDQFTGSYTDIKSRMQWFNAGFDRHNDQLTLDSFLLRPVAEKDSFLAQQTYQTDYIHFRSGRISAGPVDLPRFIKENEVHIGSVAIDQFHFTDYKDKELPFNPGIIKPLPVNLLKKVPRKFNIGTVSFTNARVDYTETGEKTKLPGHFPVTNMQARFNNVKNYAAGPTDSLNIMASGYLLDSIYLQLRVKESYTDSLGGFLMSFQVGPGDLRVLNKVLVPLSLVKLESGVLDTISMRAVGREYLALGEMHMFYHDLKVALLNNKGEEKKRKFISGLVNLLIKNSNNSRTGNVFFIRKRDRSAINYLIQIAMSGISSSIGVKKNNKAVRKYQKELEQRKLPPVNFE